MGFGAPAMIETSLTGAVHRTQHFARSRRRQQLAVSIDFSVWPNWRDAVRVLLHHSRHITRVGVSAGGPDWTFFRGPRDLERWSDAQRAQAGDLLEIAVNELGEREICTTALLDARAPRYLRTHPQDAAVDMRGRRSEEIVCSTAMAEGEYGRLLVQTFEALSASTRAVSVGVTNLQFSRHCFCARCLARFHGYAWRSDWPRLPNGAIELLNPLLGKWRSTQVAGVIARLSAFACAHGKRMLFEANLSRDDPGRNSRENGQDFGILRPHVDEFVVRDDLGVDDAESPDSAVVARHLCQAMGSEEYWHCLGLRGRDGLAVEAQPMRLALTAALRGGARRLWLTPSHYLSPSHWQQLDELMKEDYVATIAVD
jgi:hypothetical protein